MTKNSNVSLLIGICIILVLIGGFVYKTFTTYQEILDKGSIENKAKEEKSINDENAANSTELDSRIIMTKALEKQSVLMVIAFKDFRDPEYFIPMNNFLAAGALVKTASTQKGTALGAEGGKAEIDLLVKDVNLKDFDAVVFIGGSGALTYLDNEDSYKLAKEAVVEKKLLAAICIAPTILAKAGVLNAKNATVWSAPNDQSAIKILEDNGAKYDARSVVVDGNIITAWGPDAADQFGLVIVEVLTAMAQ